MYMTDKKQIIKTVSFKNNVEPEVLEFVKMQQNFSDTVLFLIQKEIYLHGVHNLQQSVSPSRTISDMAKYVSSDRIDSYTTLKQDLLPTAPFSVQENIQEDDPEDDDIPPELLL